jgi:hypothetical protein
MRDKEKYYKLDDIGHIGVQKKRTVAEMTQEKIETAKSIKVLKARTKASDDK